MVTECADHPPVNHELLLHLGKMMKNRPARRKSLVNFAKGILGKGITDTIVAKAVAELLQTGRVRIDDRDAVTYRP